MNFTRAAAKCNVSHPSLNRTIGLLKAEFGGDLFRRERNLTHLTDPGQRMVPLMTRCVENADHASRLAQASRSRKSISLKLALRDGISLEPFVPQLLQLAKAFPQIVFKIQRGNLADQEGRLKEDEVDILLGLQSVDVRDRFQHWPLYQCKYPPVLRAGHPMARKTVFSIEELNAVSPRHRPDCGVATNQRAHLRKLASRCNPR